MSQSLSQIWLHIVFSTKERRPYLQNVEFREEMFRMISHHVEQAGCYPRCSGGWIDHVHIVCGLGRTVTVAALIEHIKVETSKWAKKTNYGVALFSWQSGYGAFSVSQSNLDRVIAYVQQQDEHHKKLSFHDEFRQLCQKHGLQIDEKYAWD